MILIILMLAIYINILNIEIMIIMLTQAIMSIKKYSDIKIHI